MNRAMRRAKRTAKFPGRRDRPPIPGRQVMQVVTRGCRQHCEHDMTAHGAGEPERQACCLCEQWWERAPHGGWIRYQASRHEQDAFRSQLRELGVVRDDEPGKGRQA